MRLLRRLSASLPHSAAIGHPLDARLGTKRASVPKHGPQMGWLRRVFGPNPLRCLGLPTVAGGCHPTQSARLAAVMLASL